MEWKEQDEAERGGNRGSKSRQCEYAIHKYEADCLTYERYLQHCCSWAWLV